MPSRTVSNRKRTILGSRKLHRLYKTIMANKKLSIAIMAIVAPLVGLLVTSKGLPTNYFVGLRKILTQTSFGKKIAEWFQQLVDAILRMLGIGIRVGDVVKVRESCEDETFLEKESSRDPTGTLPNVDKTYNNRNMINKEYIVYKIGRRHTIQWIEYNDQSENPTVEQVKKLSCKHDTINFILNINVYGDSLIRPDPHIPFNFPIEHFEKTETRLDP